jgi:hypothetical protein
MFFSDLAKFEAEMREKGGKLSQTETEDDEAEDADAKKKGKKKLATKPDVSKSGKKRGKKDATPVVDEKKKKKSGAPVKLSETPMAAIAASLIAVPQVRAPFLEQKTGVLRLLNLQLQRQRCTRPEHFS